MNTKTIDKAEIVAQLRNMTEKVLFGDKWPIDDNFAVHQQLIRWGLREECEITVGATGEIEERPKSPNSKRGDICIRTTTLGRELDVDWWIMLMGHHEPAEIPDMLVQMGALTQDEADHIILERWKRDGEALEDVLPPVLRPAYRANEYFNAVKQLVSSVNGYLNSDTGSDDSFILGMEGSVADVLSKAREIPELREWAQAIARAQAVELSRQQAKN